MDQDDHHAKRSRRYVPLTREQEAPVEDIEPGELNQPINVSQVLYIFSLVHIAIYNNVRFILKYRFSSFLNGINCWENPTGDVLIIAQTEGKAH
jgi:hypothetical protein